MSAAASIVGVTPEIGSFTASSPRYILVESELGSPAHRLKEVVMVGVWKLVRDFVCPRCNGSGGHSDLGNWVICGACNGQGSK